VIARLAEPVVVTEVEMIAAETEEDLAQVEETAGNSYPESHFN